MKNLFLFFIIAVALTACKKSSIGSGDSLPPITQEGRNSFGCFINGRLYVPKGFEQNKPNFQMYANQIDGTFQIAVFRKEGDLNRRFSFGSDSISNTGLFLVGSRVDFAYNIYSNRLSDNICETPYSYGSPSNKTGYIKITRYDSLNGIISGEFEFHFVNPDCGIGDTIHITKGRFDKKLN